MIGIEFTHANIPDQHMHPDTDVCEGCEDEDCGACDGECCDSCHHSNPGDYERDPDDARDREYAYDDDEG